MNYQFQPSAVGLASQALNDFIKNRAQIDVALADLSTTVNDSQLKMGKAAADNTYASGVADSNATSKAAWMSIAGAAGSMGLSAVAVNRQHANAKIANPQAAQVGVAPVVGGAAPHNGPGAANIAAQNNPPVPNNNNAGGNQGNQGAGNQELVGPQAEAKQWQDIWSNVGMHYPTAILKIGESGGSILASYEKMTKATADTDQALAQTIQSMMKTQSDLIMNAVQGNDSGTNNAISIIQALIAANRAG